MPTPSDLQDLLRQRRETHCKALWQEVERLTMNEIAALQRALRDEHTDNVTNARISRAKLDAVRSILFSKKNGGEIGISDHAVLRYMERYKGIDVRAIRLELSEIAKAHKATKNDCHYESGNVHLVIPNRTDAGGGVVATVYPSDGTSTSSPTG